MDVGYTSLTSKNAMFFPQFLQVIVSPWFRPGIATRLRTVPSPGCGCRYFAVPPYSWMRSKHLNHDIAQVVGTGMWIYNMGGQFCVAWNSAGFFARFEWYLNMWCWPICQGRLLHKIAAITLLTYLQNDSSGPCIHGLESNPNFSETWELFNATSGAIHSSRKTMVSSCWTNLPGSSLWTRIRFTKTSLGKHPSAVSSARHDLCAMTLFRSCCPFLWKHSTQEQTLLTGAEAIIPHIAMWGFNFLFDIRRPPPSASRRPLYQLLFPLLEIQAPHDKNWYYTDQVYVTWVATNAMKLPLHIYRKWHAPRLDACANKASITTEIFAS
jgi:hypothetical protein